MDLIYLVVSTQTVPLNLNIALQLRDDPLMRPVLSAPQAGSNYVTFDYSANPDGFNPQATGLKIRYRPFGGTWSQPILFPGLSGTAQISGLSPGTQYEFETKVYTSLVPQDRESPAVTFVISTIGLPIWVKIGQGWKMATGVYVKVGGAWKQVTNCRVKVGNTWKQVF
ncbi:MAG: hypothetical protein QW518_09660 [Thermofilaceae archaeon]